VEAAPDGACDLLATQGGGVNPRTAASARTSNPGLASEGTPRLLSARSAAKYLGVPYTSLRDWALRGHIPIARVPDCRRLWLDRKDLDRAVESWKERSETVTR
jgi:excisionase family DNA binding protein